MREYYKQYGFECLVIWEEELTNIPKLITKLKRFEVKNCTCGIAPAMLGKE